MKRSWNLNGVIVCEEQSTWTISEVQIEPQLPFSSADMVYEAGLNTSKVWALDDNTFCKSKLLFPGSTLEHVTLAYLQNRHLDFEIPHVLHHEEYNGRYYIILSRVSGTTLEKAWPTMNDADKVFCVQRVAEICTQMTGWKPGSMISGVDSLNLPEQYLAAAKIGKLTADDLCPSQLLKNCQDIGLDCSRLVFYHCDLGPGNILVDLERRTIALIDWECAGYVPLEWVRTKFRISSGMDLDFAEKQDERVEWRKLVQLELLSKGFSDAVDRWFSWRRLCLDQSGR